EAARHTLSEWGGEAAARIVELNPLAAGEEEMARFLGVESELVGRRPGAPGLVPPYISPPATSPPDISHLVILGNPPWANFGRLNRGRWISNLLTDYTAGLGETKHNLA